MTVGFAIGLMMIYGVEELMGYIEEVLEQEPEEPKPIESDKCEDGMVDVNGGQASPSRKEKVYEIKTVPEGMAGRSRIGVDPCVCVSVHVYVCIFRYIHA